MRLRIKSVRIDQYAEAVAVLIGLRARVDALLRTGDGAALDEISRMTDELDRTRAYASEAADAIQSDLELEALRVRRRSCGLRVRPRVESSPDRERDRRDDQD